MLYHHISSTERLPLTTRGYPIIIWTKTFHQLHLIIPRESDCMDVIDTIKGFAQPGELAVYITIGNDITRATHLYFLHLVRLCRGWEMGGGCSWNFPPSSIMDSVVRFEFISPPSPLSLSSKLPCLPLRYKKNCTTCMIYNDSFVDKF